MFEIYVYVYVTNSTYNMIVQTIERINEILREWTAYKLWMQLR